MCASGGKCGWILSSSRSGFAAVGLLCRAGGGVAPARRRSTMAAESCFACRAPLSEAAELRRGYRTLRSGVAIGARALVLTLECECGRRFSRVESLTPPRRGEWL
jgi:hypothetical protein